jgi:hypothetical protein
MILCRKIFLLKKKLNILQLKVFFRSAQPGGDDPTGYNSPQQKQGKLFTYQTKGRKVNKSKCEIPNRLEH